MNQETHVGNVESSYWNRPNTVFDIKAIIMSVTIDIGLQLLIIERIYMKMTLARSKEPLASGR
ncbi:hypothetical protein [Ferrimonas pelagia]|uniref:Uncharacterized protein n=1 Tax=Ferrimonas pelagia TaxID=1177826 RepID=A0ABP9F3L5_9GAMM